MTSHNFESNYAQTRTRAHHIGKIAHELSQFQDEPIQMHSGATGKSGYLQLTFSKIGERSVLAKMERRVPCLVQKALYWDEYMPNLPCVTMISTAGCILQGDRLALDILVEEDACAHVTTQSATKIHSMDANYATQIQKIRVEKGGYLEFMPDPLIPHRNSRFLTETTIECDTDATVIFSEILLSGRKYHHVDEHFGFDIYSSRVSARDLSGKELFTEKFILNPKEDSLAGVGVMGRFDILGNVILLTPPKYQEQILCRLHGAYDINGQYVCGTNRLPHGCGLIFKVLSNETKVVKNQIREFWKIVREETLGITLPEPFLWR